MIEPYFALNNEELFIEQVLVEYNEDPIFFICKSDKKYYICECIDIDSMSYYVCEVLIDELIQMFKNQITMRELFVDKINLNKITLGDSPENDIVEEISEPNAELLPDENAYYKIFTKEVEDYFKRLLQEQESKKYKLIFETIREKSWSIMSENSFCINVKRNISEKDTKFKDDLIDAA